jgi:hypothetical protein
MVASAVFITDLSGKAIISRNYRGDVPLTKAIDRFAKYLDEVDDDAKKPIFHVDVNGDVQVDEDVGASGVGGEHYIYVSVRIFNCVRNAESCMPCFRCGSLSTFTQMLSSFFLSLPTTFLSSNIEKSVLS